MAGRTNILSDKPIAATERLIFALDMPSADAAKRCVEDLGDSVQFYKIGLELFMAGNYRELIDWLKRRHKKVLVDLKFFDIPRTVASAVKQLRDCDVDFATVHGNDAILEAAVSIEDGVPILAVTVLTSLDQRDMEALGFKTDIAALVLSRARRALAIGCRGVIASGLESEALRHELGEKLLIVMPGIRPGANRPDDDQKRTVDVEEAFLRGADYIVVGRPIRDAEAPRRAAEAIQSRIAALFGA